jgi:Protein of unknown function (DUF2778)
LLKIAALSFQQITKLFVSDFKKGGGTLYTRLWCLIAPCSATENACRKAPRNGIFSKAGRMTHLIETSHHYIPQKNGGLFSRVFSLTIPGVIVLTLCALFEVWILHVHPATRNEIKAPPMAPINVLASNTHRELFDPEFVKGANPILRPQSVPLQASIEAVSPEPSAEVGQADDIPPVPQPEAQKFAESVPLPPQRPAEFGRPASPPVSSRLAQQNKTPAVAAAPADNRSFFEKIFGPAEPSTPQPSGRALAYAAPEAGNLSNARNLASNPTRGYDRWTAIYDVAAHTVYMPNGTKLEAHSGLGSRLDDPRYVSERMRGATPPNIYELKPREKLFHGVPALRLLPVGNGDLHGRTGLLAHTFMLGPNGDSNGCVSFRDYRAFLQAYSSGEIKRLAVVSRLN